MSTSGARRNPDTHKYKQKVRRCLRCLKHRFLFCPFCSSFLCLCISHVCVLVNLTTGLSVSLCVCVCVGVCVCVCVCVFFSVQCVFCACSQTFDWVSVPDGGLLIRLVKNTPYTHTHTLTHLHIY